MRNAAFIVSVFLSAGVMYLLEVTGSVLPSPNSTESVLPSPNSTELQNINAEERKMKSLNSEKVKSFLETSGGGAGLLLGNIVSGIGTLATTDFSQMSAKESVKAVGDALVPMIAEGLNFIPVFGPLISGIFSGVWSLVSSIFGLPEQKSPMELLVEQLEKQFQQIRKEMAEMQKRTLKLAAEHVEKRLGRLMASILGAELSRNKYICDKYAAASHEVTQVLKTGHNITDNLRLEVMIYLHDCDNFLKDTAEGFLGHTEFADVIWIPAVVSTLARVAFLTEVVNHGKVYRLENRVLFPLWREIKKDIDKIFWFYGKYVEKRMESLSFRDNSNLTKEEFEVCQMQQSIFYMDLDVYPYGVPSHQQVIHGNDSHLDLEKFVTRDSDKPVHVQIFYHHPTSNDPDTYGDFINCFMGPVQARVPRFYLSMKITFVTKKAYMLRVLYLLREGDTLVNRKNDENKNINVKSLRFSLHQEAHNSVKIMVDNEKPNKEVERFEYPTQYFVSQCPKKLPRYCAVVPDVYFGKFVIESVEPFAVLPEKDEPIAKGRISIEIDMFVEISVMGFEIITMPLVGKELSVG